MMFLLISLILILCHTSYSAKPSVIIVGAGASGIAAATKLLENSITNLTILEAENGIGGRIHSIKFYEAFVDIGAEYCHGEKGNIVYKLAKNLNILKPGLMSFCDNIYYSNGSKVDSYLLNEIKLIANEADSRLKGNKDYYNTTGRSVGDVLRYRLNLFLSKNHGHDTDNLKILKESMRFLDGMVIQSEGSFSSNDASADSEYESCEGNQAISWNGHGYKTILEILMKSFPDSSKKLPIDDKIYLNKKVTKIDWYSDRFVTVKTRNGNTYKADYVIFTPSIGVLKQQKNSMFNPPLPSSKQYAIDAIGFGAVMKVFMYFPIRWWNDDTIISFFWREEDINSIEFQKGPTKNGISWVVQLREVLQAPNNPNVLTGWISGDLVPEIERMPLEILKEGCNYVLAKFVGSTYNVAKIDLIMRSTWHSNDNFLGSYSFVKTGFYNEHFSYPKIVAEPLNGVAGHPVLLFAGEATNPIHHSTVHGAIETGFREAERIIKLHRTQYHN